VRDDASPRLRELRARIAALHERLRKQIVEHLRDQDVEELLQDSYFTLREDRYVLPVKAQHRSHVPGIVHGSSNTGQTVYIEPEALIDTNNQLKIAEQEAEHEIWQIRRELSGLVGGVSDEVRDSLALLGELDSLSARALFSRELDGVAPDVAEGGALRLRRVRNPLLVLQRLGNRDAEAVVPNDIVLGDEFRVLVVTGPNTGGKTITLSTIGLCALMAQAGYHVPAWEGSALPVFDAILTSFGDAQNIRRGLSTFSGHLARLTEILERAGERSLVLLDEILVGTEPSQGSALAVAYLEAFAARGATTAVATHYDRLKTLSYADTRFRNASVGLDPDRLIPTYRLSAGLPGSSSPIAIAERLGVAPALVARARDILGEGALSLDDVIRDLETERKALLAEREEAERARRDLDRARERHDEESRKLRRDAARLAREAAQTTVELAERLRREIDAMRKDVREERRQGALTEAALEGRRRRVRDIEEEARKATPPDPEAPPPIERRPLRFEECKAGRKVWLETIGREAQIEADPRDPKRIPVAIGTMRLTVELDSLREPLPSDRGGRGPQPRAITGVGQKDRAFQDALPNYDERTPPPKVSDNSLDLRGMYREDALQALEKALDEAATSGRPVLWIVHGHGSGTLKKAVRDYLNASSYVAHHRPGERAEGGDGVTLVWLD
jgi:DNA mismatch repair protein MutS2